MGTLLQAVPVLVYGQIVIKLAKLVLGLMKVIVLFVIMINTLIHFLSHVKLRVQLNKATI
jgi:hypothetical protein